MATRSMIGQMQDDQTILAIYCHWDGYPEHNGRLLKDHWTDRAKVKQMLDLGDMSVLGEEIGKKHHFDDRDGRGNGCAFYGRDRNEDVSNTVYKMASWLECEGYMGAEFLYLQGKDGRWSVSEESGSSPVPVAQAIEERAEALD